MEEELIRLNGKVMYILFHNDQNFYTVAKFRINDEKERVITITGLFPSIETDQNYVIYGSYIEHPRYGMQFKVENYEKPLPSEEEGIIKYLSGASFKGIGKSTAEKVVKALGDQCLSMIREDPYVLRTIPGLTEKQILAIEEGMKQQDDGLEELVRFLNVHGVGMRNLARLNKAYGQSALNKIKENPYRVIEECDGFGFATADKIAQSLGFDPADERRLYAFMVSAVMDFCMSSGDTFVTKEALKNYCARKMNGIEEVFDELLDQASLKRSLIVDEDRVYAVSQFDAERSITSYLTGFPYRKLEEIDVNNMYAYLRALETRLEIEYDDRQKEALQTFFEEDFMIVTGGPGTGKTTVVRAMTSLFSMLYPDSTVVCAAPTGRAAKRLAELTGTQAATIHSLLQWDLESNTFNKNEEDPITADLLIVDEFSMVDSYLFASLLRACRNVQKICLIGDEDQLPSVGPGCVLRDLIETDLYPVIRLEHIYRQKEGSDVIALAHDINTGEVDFAKYGHDVLFHRCPSYDVRRNVLSVVQSAVDKGYSTDDIQVLSPMYNGTAGIDVLNNALQELLNPPAQYKREVRSGYMTLREGDKILQLKNQPDDGVYNGDIGVLEEIIPAKETEDHKITVVVNFQGILVEYKPDNFINITLAYCTSVHKSQGNEYPIVIMPFTSQHTIMLQRKLIYTAVTRARRALVLLGDPDAFTRGIGTLERHRRETTLVKMLKEVYARYHALAEEDYPF